MAPMLLLLWLPPIPPPLTSQATESDEEEAGAAVAVALLAFSLKAAAPSPLPKKFARGGRVSEKERVACASDFAAEDDEGKEGARHLQRLGR